MRATSNNPAVLSYYTMRRAVGIIALTLPFTLAVGSILAALLAPGHALPHPLLERSISDYYYTPMRDFLVGSLFAIAAFLACSRGYDLRDEIAGYLAGAFTFGVALFPSVDPRTRSRTGLQINIGVAHAIFAALMFFVLAYFCLILFRKSSPEKPLTRRKQHRNRVYAVSGLVIVACMLVMLSLLIQTVAAVLWSTGALFWCESLALAAFGVAWLTKGEGFLRDKPLNHVRHSTAVPHPRPEIQQIHE